MTCRKNGSTVFQCHSHYLGSAVGCNLHLISESRNPEVSRRHQARLAVGAHRLHGFIIRAIHLLAILHKIVSGDSVDRRHTACIETSMTNGGNRWNIRNTGVFAREALVEQSLESTFTIAFLIAIEIIPTHLVNHDAHYQFGALNVRNIHLLGSSRAASTLAVRRWVPGSKVPMESISSSKNSQRTGCSIRGEKTSRMPPRRANCPTPST